MKCYVVEISKYIRGHERLIDFPIDFEPFLNSLD